jgi:hypothetical protein
LLGSGIKIDEQCADACIGAKSAQIGANRGLPGPPLVETTAVTFMGHTSESKY